MLSLEAVEEVCESKQTTVVVHPAVRQAIKGYEESFYIGLQCFLDGKTDGIYDLPLRTSGFERLVLSKRTSPGGFSLLRIEPLRLDGLLRIKSSLIAAAGSE